MVVVELVTRDLRLRGPHSAPSAGVATLDPGWLTAGGISNFNSFFDRNQS
jgi:hypothetical protein